MLIAKERKIREFVRQRPVAHLYFYEEDNWADDMQLAAAEMYNVLRN